MTQDKSVVGDLINFRGLVYAPLNENGVVFLFGKVVDDLHMYIEEIKPGFPDCIARRYTGKGWERVAIEFEYASSNFKQHGHNPNDCDVVVCWEHDWKDCPLEVIELRSSIDGMKNWPIKPPTTTKPGVKPTEALLALYQEQHIQDDVRAWYAELEQRLRQEDPEIWANIGKKYIGLYSPEKSFASIKPRPTAIQVECFSRGETLSGTKVSNLKFSPRWAKFTIKAQSDIAAAVGILRESQARLKAALKEGESTSYFSGGIKPGSDEAGEADDKTADEET
jgi:hypothetical protein